jgi:hypothetical protein
MRAVLEHELANYGEGSTDMSISASGEGENAGGTRTFSIWISGRATPVTVADPAPPAAPPAPEEPPEPPAGARAKARPR